MNRTSAFNLRRLTAVCRWYPLPTYLIYSSEELKKALPYVDRTMLIYVPKHTYAYYTYVRRRYDRISWNAPGDQVQGCVSRASSSRCCGGGKRRVQSVAVARARRLKNSGLADTRRYSAGLAPNA